MIITVTSESERENVLAALMVINALRRPRATFPTCPLVEDTPWVRTLWPNQKYL